MNLIPIKFQRDPWDQLERLYAACYMDGAGAQNSIFSADAFAMRWRCCNRRCWWCWWWSPAAAFHSPLWWHTNKLYFLYTDLFAILCGSFTIFFIRTSNCKFTKLLLLLLLLLLFSMRLHEFAATENCIHIHSFAIEVL